ncbi:MULTISPECIES: hypothetical protein [Rhodococcus]|uniref:hypothetical protein n=1 Tax=Rhodococcus TaxID=1827 RepID=UPI0008734A3D|nr:hypothetical protein [Rhodococcus sp. 1139]OFE08361.1 hypothetical protein A5N83_12920 [Rhodococcus sp. 1139]
MAFDLDDRTLAFAEAARKTARELDTSFAALTDMLTVNPTVKQLLAAGLTHARVARTVQLRKQQVGIIARTPFHASPFAQSVAVDPWKLGGQLWGGTETFTRAVNHALEWDIEHLDDIAPVRQHAAEYGINTLEEELGAYQCAYARCQSVHPHTPRISDVHDKRIAALRCGVLGATENDLRDAETSILDLIDTPLVPEIPNHIYTAAHGRIRADQGHPWEQALFEAREAREADELKNYGRLRPTIADDSLDPRILARDIKLFNFGDQRVNLIETTPATGPHRGQRRENILRDFALDTLHVSWDQHQTISPTNRPPEDIEREIAHALGKYLVEHDPEDDFR